MPMIKPEIFDNSQFLHQAAAEYFTKCYQLAISNHRSFHVALSGGSTPKRLYQLLTTATYCEKINWQQVHFYFGDERFVPHDSEDSNYKMAKEAMLDSLACPEENIHAVDTSLPVAGDAAKKYAKILSTNLPLVENKPVFDFVLLGLGTDGHTASLFPGTKIITIEDQDCAAVYVETQESWRISITFPMINRAKHILLLSENVTKSDIVKLLVEWDKVKPHYPVQRIAPQNEMRWYIDHDAARFI